MARPITVDLIHQSTNIQNKLQYGCLLDTNILISASLPIDPANDKVEELLQVFKNSCVFKCKYPN